MLKVSIKRTHVSLAALLIAVLLTAGGRSALAQGADPSFLSGTLTGTAGLSNPSTLAFGPDGRLYAGQVNGVIRVYEVTRTGPGAYTATQAEVITLINAIPNHDDDGSLNTGVGGRQMTGLIVHGTPANPVIYATSSDPRVALKNDLGLDTNSGTLSMLTRSGGVWSKVDLVRGLPRQEHNHATNGIALDEATLMTT